MTASPVSVIVVSRGRPEALRRCLRGLEQLCHDDFEVVVVADAGGCAVVQRAGLAERVKLVAFEAPNISEARNLGLAQAAGGIVAFIDDDAVPEPTWLDRLAVPFRDPRVDAAGGYVLGRNGISFQYRARSVDGTGQHSSLEIDGDAPVVLAGTPGRAIKTEGTNCAFRRDLLLAAGGFDPAFAFYLDETDLNLHLAAQGRHTAIVPLAQVHHGFAASDRRDASRMPRSLFDVGASQAVLLRKHAPDADHGEVLRAFRAEQKARLMRHMVDGNCEPRDVARVMQTLNRGIAAGRARPLSPLLPIKSAGATYRRFTEGLGFAEDIGMAGRTWQKARLRREAARRVAHGSRVSLFLFSPTALFHRVAFSSDGVWEQRGGLWGKSDRKDAAFVAWGFASRARRELDRVSEVRNLRIPVEL